MTPRRPRLRPESGNWAWTLRLACVVAGLLASGAAAVALAGTLHPGPRVGDILVLRPSLLIAADWQIEATRSDGRLCTLKPVVMSAAGGSIVVEQELVTTHAFHVHWAGPHTDDGPGDCGSAAELTLSVADLRMLTNVVGVAL